MQQNSFTLSPFMSLTKASKAFWRKQCCYACIYSKKYTHCVWKKMLTTLPTQNVTSTLLNTIQ